MTKAVALVKGMFVKVENTPYMVMDKEFYSPGKGASVARLKLKNLKTGQIIKKVLRSDVEVKDIFINNRALQFLYKDGQDYVFMDPKSFEQIEFSSDFIGKAGYFLEAGKNYQIAFFNDMPVNIRLPAKVVLEVAEAPRSVKGGRVSGENKEVKLVTGYKLKAPTFINVGDKVVVNTDTGEYVKKA